MMPDMDGYEVCKTPKRKPMTAKIPVKFSWTAKTPTIKDEEPRALQWVRWITLIKPSAPPIVRAESNAHRANTTKHNYRKSRERTQALEAQPIKESYHHLGQAVENRDNETGAHVNPAWVTTLVLLQKHSDGNETLGEENFPRGAQCMTL